MSSKKSAATGNKTSIESVVAYLKDEIRRGRMVPGQRLAEIDITEATGASRAKVRSALQNLAVEGLVTVEPFRGASVRRISADEILQLYRVREALEGLAARTVAERADPEALREISSLQSDMDKSVDNLDYPQFATLNHQWHSALIRLSGNSYIIDFVDRMMIPMFRMSTQLLNRPGTIDEANKDHKKITQAILDQDPDTVERLMRLHISHALNKLQQDSPEMFADAD